MALRITKDQAYQRGFKAAKQPAWFTDSIIDDVESSFPSWRKEFPLSAHLDYRAEIVKLWKQRLAADLNIAKYPECKGLPDIVHAEHQGYLDGAGGSEVAAAYFYSFSYFLRLRLSTRYFGFPDHLKGTMYTYAPSAAAECTTVWFADTPDGPVHAKNLDTSPNQLLPDFRPGHIFGGKPPKGITDVGGATSCVLCDDEPDEIFPVRIDDIIPEDIQTVRDYVPFRYRYRQFSGPHNCVYVDQHNDSVAIEQTNTRMGWKFGENGVSGVTGLSYQTPELKAFKAERDQLSLEKRGWTHDSPDYVYWQGCNKRYDRLTALMDQAAKEGPTVEHMANIMLDPHGPVPERISAANEPCYPGVDTNFWTMGTWVTVMYGPQRRTFRWANPTTPDSPIWKRDPKLLIEDDVAMRPEFETQRQRLAQIGK